MRPVYYISRMTLEKLIQAAEASVELLAKQKRYGEADHADDIWQALKELHEHNYGPEAACEL